jgi:hypothetical protein
VAWQKARIVKAGLKNPDFKELLVLDNNPTASKHP